MKSGWDKINAGQEALELGLERDPQPAAVRSQQLLERLGAAWTTLGFDTIEDEAFFQLVAARVTRTITGDRAHVRDDHDGAAALQHFAGLD